MKFSPLPSYLVPLRPKYSPQHPILKHLQPTLKSSIIKQMTQKLPLIPFLFKLSACCWAHSTIPLMFSLQSVSMLATTAVFL
jgi:hypothetical protein